MLVNKYISDVLKTKLEEAIKSVKNLPSNTEDVCSAFLFFDPVHPAGKAHKFIAEYAIDLIEKNGIFFQ